MATKTIGTLGSEDYSTPQAWEDALAATLTEAEIGQVSNQEFDGGSSPVLTIAGHTTSATNYIHITTASGASFVENANIETNALRYNASNGAAFTSSGAYDSASTVWFDDNNCKISKLQVRNSATGIARAFTTGNTFPDGCDIDQCVFEGKWTEAVASILGQIPQGFGKIRNSVIITRQSAATRIVSVNGGVAFYNTTIVVPDDLTPATNGLTSSYGTLVLHNCAVFGATTLKNGSSTESFTTSYTDAASPPTGFTQVTYSDQFENVNDATRDFRLKSGADCIDNGTTDPTNAATSINNVSRPSGSAYDVGAWEFVAAGGGALTWNANSAVLSLGVPQPTWSTGEVIWSAGTVVLQMGVPNPAWAPGEAIWSAGVAALGLSTTQPAWVVGEAQWSPNATVLTLNVPAPTFDVQGSWGPDPVALGLAAPNPTWDVGEVIWTPDAVVLNVRAPQPAWDNGTGTGSGGWYAVFLRRRRRM